MLIVTPTRNYLTASQSVPNAALGSYEAACVLGVHFTQTMKMAGKGDITSRVLPASAQRKSDRVVAVYSWKECEANFQEYLASQQTGRRRRSRKYLDLRAEMSKRLADVHPLIDYYDAIGCTEAADILGCHWTWPPRMVNRGEIVGRLLINERLDSSASNRLIVLSRVSCVANAIEYRRLRLSGRLPGRPRKVADARIAAEQGGEVFFVEGRLVTHRLRERSKALRKHKLRIATDYDPRLPCEVCSFQFIAFYGDRGRGFAECHHREPISEAEGTRKSKVEDLAVVCANCHRMLHRRDWISVAELRDHLASIGSISPSQTDSESKNPTQGG